MPTTEQPRTPTGRYVLEEWQNEGGPDPEMLRAILAIERDAAAPALDVVKWAYDHLRPYDHPPSCSPTRCTCGWVEFVAEYAALSESAPPVAPETER